MSEHRSGSIGFDRAAEYYDRTRRLSGPAMAGVIRMLKHEVLGRGRCLEIGVGTGRMAIPLQKKGAEMAGVDLSAKMLRTLIERSGGRARFPVAQADAVALPFGDRTFGAAVACHVLHLIPSWPDAVRELVRVVRPGGVILIDLGGSSTGWWEEIQLRFCREAGTEKRYAGLSEVEELDEFVAGLGLSQRTLSGGTDVTTQTLEERIRWLEEGIFSYTWSLDEATRQSAAAAVRGWAAESFGPLDEPRTTEFQIVWRAYDLP